MAYNVTVTLDTRDPEAVTGLKELLATQAQEYGDVRGVRVEEVPARQMRMEGFR